MKINTPIYVTFPMVIKPDFQSVKTLNSEMDIELASIEYIRGITLDGLNLDGTEIGLKSGKVITAAKPLKDIRRIMSVANERRFNRYKLTIKN